MSTIIAVRHLKARQSQCGITLEPCEDRGCEVDAAGHASCGRLACPNCGFEIESVEKRLPSVCPDCNHRTDDDFGWENSS